MSEIKAVKLKNGTIEAEPLIQVVGISLGKLYNSEDLGGAMAFHDLVMLCRDRTYQVWDNVLDDLKAFSLVRTDGTVHESIRNIVLSSVTGEGLDMQLQDPRMVKEVTP